MPRDREQLTPDEPEDAGKVRPRRSAAIEAEDTDVSEWGRGPGSHGSDPPAHDEVEGSEKDEYK